MEPCWFIKNLPVTLVYVHVLNSDDYLTLAKRFLGTYGVCHPGLDHLSTVICNGAPADEQTRKTFASLPRCDFFNHDNGGFDIGGYIALARKIKTGPMFCCGASTHFRRPGWLARMVQSWNTFGPGMYGSLATYEVRPHFCTTGFLVAAEMLAAYPILVHSKQDRYAFEHGPNALVQMAMREGVPTKLVTWDGVYDWKQWRKAPNIYARGDQSNCLTYFRVSDSYETSPEFEKKRRQKLADTQTTSNSI